MDQSEIDALMGDDSDDGNSDDGNSGELSQADIDAAMAGGAASSGPADETPPTSDATQADSTTQAGSATQADSATQAGDAGQVDDAGVSFDDADGGGFSQADIDALMGGGGSGGGSSEAAPAEVTPSADAGDAASDGPELDSEGRPLDEMGAAMAAAIAEEQAAAATASSGAQASSQPTSLPLEEVVLPAFDEEEVYTESTQPLSLLHDVQLHVKIELGRTRMFVEDVLHLGEGSVVELDRLAGDPVDVFVNERLVARGEVLVLNDNFCVRVSEIISGAETRAAC